MKSFFNVVFVVVVVMFSSSCGMMATAGNAVTDETEDKSVDEVVDDEKVVTDNEITDEIVVDEETDLEVSDTEITDEEIDSEVNDSEVVDEEVTDEDSSLPEVVVSLLSNDHTLDAGEKIDICITISSYSKVFTKDTCIRVGFSSATMGIDYGIDYGIDGCCGPGTIKIAANSISCSIITLQNLWHRSERLFRIEIQPNSNYRIFNQSQYAEVVLLSEEEHDEEVSDEETDSEVTDDVIDGEISDEEVADEATDEEISDEDTSLPEIIIATESGTSLHCKPFQTLIAPGNSVDLWNSGGTKSPTITNSTSTPVWYSHTGWCAATSDKLFDARGEGWEKFGVYRTGHNGDD
ncbi:MAG: hypothetical protein Q7J14_00950 [Candidatus Magasanikbacteria bacterium]|nr:hypothetical protein [Candidatus Magasanikbacteria bacterium]